MAVRAEHRENGIHVVTVVGEVDLGTADDLLEALSSVPATDHLIIDVTGVTFFGSSGISALVQTRDWAHRDGRYLYLVDGALGNRSVTDTLHHTGLIELFDVHGSADDLVRTLTA